MFRHTEYAKINSGLKQNRITKNNLESTVYRLYTFEYKHIQSVINNNNNAIY